MNKKTPHINLLFSKLSCVYLFSSISQIHYVHRFCSLSQIHFVFSNIILKAKSRIQLDRDPLNLTCRSLGKRNKTFRIRGINILPIELYFSSFALTVPLICFEIFIITPIWSEVKLTKYLFYYEMTKIRVKIQSILSIMYSKIGFQAPNLFF